MLSALRPAKAPPVHFEYEGGWPQNRFIRFMAEKKSLSFSGNRTAIPQLYSPYPRHYNDYYACGVLAYGTRGG